MNTVLLLLVVVNFMKFVDSYRGISCPRKCYCYESMNSVNIRTEVIVDCSKRKLHAVPSTRMPLHVTTLALHENYITELAPFAFDKYRYLKELYLYKNFILNAHKDTFR